VDNSSAHHDPVEESDPQVPVSYRIMPPAPLPPGFAIELDPGTRQLTESVLFGGSPARAMRLSAAGRAALAELRAGPITSAAAGLLARRLTDAGLAHPRPPQSPGGNGPAASGPAASRPAADESASVAPAADESPSVAPAADEPAAGRPLGTARAPAAAVGDVTVLIPVRDRVAELDRCLAAVGGEHRVIVVDDGSADQAAIAAVAARHGASLVRRPESGGPAAARNTGLAAVATGLVAFLDSDCVPPPGWIRPLAAHLADPAVGAVAPRVIGPAAPKPAPGPVPGRGQGRPSAAVRYAARCGSLDLGGSEARMQPMTRVSYVPTAALVVRRAALDAIGTRGEAFDPALRYGEDVDLVWRLHDAGWRIRYEPAVQVLHEGPGSWPGILGRRFRYGTSAGPLARRHPGRLTPLVLQPWPAAAVAAVLARRPVTATAAASASWLTLTQTVRRAGLPADGAPAATLTAIRQTWLGAGRYSTQFAAPLLAAVLVRPGGRTAAGRLGRRAAAASLLLGPVLDGWRRTRRPQPGDGPELDPVRFAAGHIAADIAYGAGVWTGCARARTLAPVTPRLNWRPMRITEERNPADGQHLV
jgi:mycofactocin system glycosyltransferase